jgi:hypothetical protein
MVDPITGSYIADTGSTATAWFIVWLSANGPNSRLRRMQKDMEHGIKVIHEVKHLLDPVALDKAFERYSV